METATSRRELLTSVGCGIVGLGTAGRAPGVAAAGPAQVLEAEWTQFGYDATNTGHNPETPAPQSGTGVAWEAETNAPVSSSPAVNGGIVYIGSNDGNLYGFDATNGLGQLVFETENAVRSSPAVGDGLVYVGSNDGRIYAVDATDGEEAWRFGTGGRITAAPTVDAGTVYAASTDGTLYAIDATEGTEQWRFEIGSELESSPALRGTGDEATVVLGSWDTNVYGVDAETGEEAWVFEEPDDLVVSDPAVVDGVVYVGSNDGSLYAIDAATGEGVWSVPTGGAIPGSPAVADGAVYAGNRPQGSVFALDADTGEEEWTFDIGRPVLSSPAVADGTLYVGSDDQLIYAIDVGTGEEEWSFETDSPIRSSPAVVDILPDGATTAGTVYIGSDDEGVYALAEGAADTDHREGLPENDGSESTADGGGTPGGDTGGGGIEAFAWLLWPLVFFTIVAAIVGSVYTGLRLGWLAVDDEDPVVTARETDEPPGLGSDEGDDGEDGIPVWDFVLEDIIGRSEATHRTAREDLLVTKYADTDSMPIPVVAYEIESYREKATRLRLTEPVFDGEPPRGMEGWHVDEEQLVFDRVIEPGETVTTLVARDDAAEDVTGLLESPDITVDPA